MIRSSNILKHRKGPIIVASYDANTVDYEGVQVENGRKTIFSFSRPLNDRETRFLKEGQRSDHFRVLNYSGRLSIADDILGVVGDTIENHLGFRWRVVGGKEWGDATQHSNYMIQKIGVENATQQN